MMIWRFVHQHLAECRNDVHYRYHIIWKVAYKENSVNHPHVHANLMWISFEKSLSCVFCVEILEVFDICKKKISKHGHSKPWCELVCDVNKLRKKTVVHFFRDLPWSLSNQRNLFSGAYKTCCSQIILSNVCHLNENVCQHFSCECKCIIVFFFSHFFLIE